MKPRGESNEPHRFSLNRMTERHNAAMGTVARACPVRYWSLEAGVVAHA